MIAQWDSSPSVLPVARVMITQWDSSLLTVTQVMIAQWDSSSSVLPVAWVQFPTMAEGISSRDFSLADHMRCLAPSSGSTKEWSGTTLEKKPSVS